MGVWDLIKEEQVNIPKKQFDFLNEIQEVCKKYNLSISHEDFHGSFQIEEYKENNIDWLKNADVNWQ